MSYHNHWKILEGYHGGFEAFAEAFINDIAGYYSPFLSHVLGKSQLESGTDNILYMTRMPHQFCIFDICINVANVNFLNVCQIFQINEFDQLKQLFFIHAEYWNVRHMSNVCFITYEEMKCDLAAVVRKVSSFLGHPVPEEKMATFVDHLSFDKMKKNAAVNKQDFVEVTTFYI